MECIDPTALPAGALAAFAEDPENDDELVTHHIAQCAFCASEVNQMREALHVLSQRLYRFDCPDTVALDAYAAGDLAPAAAESVAAHLLTCARCTEEVGMARAALAIDEPLLSWHAPGLAHQIDRAVRRLAAALMTPAAGGQMAAARLRGTDEISPPRIFHVENVSISLREAEDSPSQDGQRTLDGVLSITDEPDVISQSVPITVLRISGDEAVPVAGTQAELGAFTLGPLEPGHYQIIFALGDREIVVEDLGI